MIEREWKEEFNIGCDYVDSAHRKLFRILWKVIDLVSEKEYEKHKHACIEAIKFLYNYTAIHFSEEEAYMKEIGYAGYEAHKKVHDEIRNEKVPTYDAILKESDYSKEAVREFVGFFIGWLTGHILIMDKAITSTATDDIITSSDSINEKIIKELDTFTKRFLNYSLTVISKTYDDRIYEDAIYYELSYSDADIMFMAQTESVKAIVSGMTGKTVEVIDKGTIISFVQLMMNVGKMVYSVVGAETDCKVDSHRIIALVDIEEHIKEKTISNYIHWKAEHGDMEIFVFK